MGANADLVRRYVAAVSAGDTDAMATFLSEDMVFHIGGRNPMSGDQDKTSFMSRFLTMLERSGGAVPVEVHDLLESDDHVVALLRRTLAGVDASAAIVYHVASDAITEVWPFEGDQYAIDEAMRA